MHPLKSGDINKNRSDMKFSSEAKYELQTDLIYLSLLKQKTNKHNKHYDWLSLLKMYLPVYKCLLPLTQQSHF